VLRPTRTRTGSPAIAGNPPWCSNCAADARPARKLGTAREADREASASQWFQLAPFIITNSSPERVVPWLEKSSVSGFGRVKRKAAQCTVFEVAMSNRLTPEHLSLQVTFSTRGPKPLPRSPRLLGNCLALRQRHQRLGGRCLPRCGFIGFSRRLFTSVYFFSSPFHLPGEAHSWPSQDRPHSSTQIRSHFCAESTMLRHVALLF
jgi:hypothetical protein